MPGYPVCSAVTKIGSRFAICDLPHGHPGNHKAMLGVEPLEWAPEVW